MNIFVIVFLINVIHVKTMYTFLIIHRGGPYNLQKNKTVEVLLFGRKTLLNDCYLDLLFQGVGGKSSFLLLSHNRFQDKRKENPQFDVMIKIA